MDREKTIKQNLKTVQEQIALAAATCGRNPEEITLVAVSKFVGADAIRAAYQAGQRDFGENRIQDCAEKVTALKSELPGARWHMIGHLQTNKVKKCVELFDTVQSVDSVRLAKELSRRNAEAGLAMEILVQVNSSGETQKSGFSFAEIEDRVGEILEFSNITLRGLMTMGPLTDNETKIREAFEKTRNLFEKLRSQNFFVDFVSPQTGAPAVPELSMGMSGDYRIAIEEGSTMVRIGTAIFGPREY